MERDGYGVIWTPPYLPDVQPVELFWAGGKNYATDQFINKQTMRDTVADLCNSWYGNLYPPHFQNRLIVEGPPMVRGNCGIVR